MPQNDSISRAPPLSETIAERLVHDISFGAIALGAVLSENRLAERFGTSKTPVREALLRLQSFDLVVVQPQRGAVVFRPDRSSVRDLSNFRLMLETGALESVASDALPLLGQELAAIALEMRRWFSLTDPREYQLLDNAYHMTIIRRSDNSFLIDAYSRIAPKICALRTYLSTPQRYLLEKSLEEHEAMSHQLVARHLDHVLAKLGEHIRRTSESHQKLVPDAAPTAVS